MYLILFHFLISFGLNQAQTARTAEVSESFQRAIVKRTSFVLPYHPFQLGVKRKFLPDAVMGFQSSCELPQLLMS